MTRPARSRWTMGEFGPVRVIPVPLRHDVTVHIANLPHDLTAAEANKLARLVLAYAVDEARPEPASNDASGMTNPQPTEGV